MITKSRNFKVTINIEPTFKSSLYFFGKQLIICNRNSIHDPVLKKGGRDAALYLLKIPTEYKMK